MIQFTKRSPQAVPAALVLSFLAGGALGWKVREWDAVREGEQRARADRAREAQRGGAEEAPPQIPGAVDAACSERDGEPCVETTTTTTTTTVTERRYGPGHAAASPLAALLVEEGAVQSTIEPEAAAAVMLREMLPYGLPSTENLIVRPGLVLSFNKRTRNPNWVAQRLRRTDAATPSRERYRFQDDPLIPAFVRASLHHYRQSGFDRGHLAPFADVKCAFHPAMDAADTFFLSNVCPQVGRGFNRDYWARLEKFARSQTETWDDVFILSGPLYLPQRVRASSASDTSAHSSMRDRLSADLRSEEQPPSTDAAPLSPFARVHDMLFAAGTASVSDASQVAATTPAPDGKGDRPRGEEDDTDRDDGSRMRAMVPGAPVPAALAMPPLPDERSVRRFVRYDVLGSPYPLAVPTHFFKAVLVRRAPPSINDASSASGESSGEALEISLDTSPAYALAVFVLPNASIPENTPLTSFLVPPAAFERMSGIRLHPRLLQLPDDDANAFFEPAAAAEEETWQRAFDRVQSAALCAQSQCELPKPGWWKKTKEAGPSKRENEESNATASNDKQGLGDRAGARK